MQELIYERALKPLLAGIVPWATLLLAGLPQNCDLDTASLSSHLTAVVFPPAHRTHNVQPRSDLNRLGHLRATFGEPSVEINPETGYPLYPIWVAEPQNYSNTQLFPAGRADERLYLNVLEPGDLAYLSCETKARNSIHEIWFATLKRGKERNAISANELHSLGSLEAYLERSGFSVKSFPNHASEMAARKVLKAKTTYATYFLAAHGHPTMFCGYLKTDGTVVNYGLDAPDGPYACAAHAYPRTGFPYPITPGEERDMHSPSGADRCASGRGLHLKMTACK